MGGEIDHRQGRPPFPEDQIPLRLGAPALAGPRRRWQLDAQALDPDAVDRFDGEPHAVDRDLVAGLRATAEGVEHEPGEGSCAVLGQPCARPSR